LWGNSYSEIVTDGNGDVAELWPMNPRRVEILRTGNSSTYRVWLPNGGFRDLRQEQVFHVSNLGFDGGEGKSPITLHREALGISFASEKYGASFYGNNASLGLVLQHPGRLSDTAHAHLKRDIAEQHTGAKNAY